MTNVKQEIKGNKLILTVDLTEEHGSSSSGKTKVIGTTHGFTWIVLKTDNGQSIGFSLNVNSK